MNPYPGISPNIRVVNETGGLTRQCIVIDIKSLGGLDGPQMAAIKEKLASAVSDLSKIVPIIETLTVADDSQFDRILLEGLRLSRDNCK